MASLRCAYSVVRFVNDPVRFEPRNIGVLVQCPDVGYFDGLFTTELRRKLSGIADAIDFEIIEEYLAEFRRNFEFSKKWQEGPALFDAPPFMLQGFLDTLSENGYDKLLFTQPKGLVSQDPSADLQRLFERFVQTPSQVQMLEIEKPASEHRAQVESVFRKRHLIRKGAVRSRYPVEVREHRFACDFGYRARREVLIEVVDLTSEVFPVRLRHFSPSVIKFKLVKENKPNTSRIALLKTAPTSNGSLSLEQSTLREFSTDILDVDKDKSKFSELLERMDRDTSGSQRLFQ